MSREIFMDISKPYCQRVNETDHVVSHRTGFGVYDKKGREVGACVALFEGDYVQVQVKLVETEYSSWVEQVDGPKVGCYCPIQVEPGHFYAFEPCSTRGGRGFGAYAGARYFRTSEEREAAIQARFAQRARHSSTWHVPRVYAATERVIEMEYVDDAVNISRATLHFVPRDAQAYRRELARKFMFTLLSQVLIHQEVHGDLHPGNVMVDRAGRLHLIDWGNTVQLSGKLAPLWRYLKGALVAEPEAVTDALIAICTEPEAATARRSEIRDAMARTLAKRRIAPLGRHFVWTLAREGPDGWIERAQMLGQLMSNTQHLGLVVRAEYLHLSRSASAMAATLGGLYKDVPRHRVAADLVWVLNSFPARALGDAVRGRALA